PRPGDTARACTPAGRCPPLAEVRPAAWARGERRDPRAARRRGPHTRGPARLLPFVCGGNDDRDARGVGLARERGAARLDAGRALGGRAPRGQRGRARDGGAATGRGTGFASLAVLRFTAPTRAWLLDFRFTGGHSHDKDYVHDTLVGDGYTSKANVDARIGRRFYQGRGKAVVSFQTVGVLGGYAHACS